MFCTEHVVQLFSCLCSLCSTDPWTCQCSNTTSPVPQSSFSASSWLRSLSLRSEYELIILSLSIWVTQFIILSTKTLKEKLELISVFLCFLSLQPKGIGDAVWSTSVCPHAHPGNLFLWSLTGQCYTGEKSISQQFSLKYIYFY